MSIRARAYEYAAANLPEPTKRRLRRLRLTPDRSLRRVRSWVAHGVSFVVRSDADRGERLLRRLNLGADERNRLWLALDEAHPGVDPDRRLEWLDEAVAAAPSDPSANERRIQVLRSAGRTDEAKVAEAVWALLGGRPSGTEAPFAAHLVQSVIEESDRHASGVLRAATGSADEAHLETVGTALVAAGGPRVSGADLFDFLEALHGAGHVRLTRDIATSYDGVVSSARLKLLRSKLDRDHAVLTCGVDLRTPALETYIPRSAPLGSLYLLHNSLPHQSGGYATRTHGLLSGMNALGYQVAGVTRPGFPTAGAVFRQRADVDPFDDVDNVRYHRLIGKVPATPRGDLNGFVQLYAKRIRPLLGEYRPPIIHGASNWWNGHAAVGIARAAGVPSIYEVRGLWEVTRSSRQPGWAGTDLYRIDAAYEAAACREADAVIAITNGLRDELVRRGVDADKIRIAPNAVDVDRFEPQPADAELQHELDLSDRVVIGFVGSLTFYEGLDDLLDAAALIHQRSTTPFVLLFVGDGPVRADLEAKAEELGVASLCRFVGRVPHEQIERYLSVIDITPFPRKPLPVCEMVSPLKPLESMASGIAVLVSDVQALDEMVGDDERGLRFSKGSVGDLADKLEALMNDEAARARLTEEAESWVRRERSWTVVSRSVGSLYEELV